MITTQPAPLPEKERIEFLQATSDKQLAIIGGAMAGLVPLVAKRR